MENIIEISKLNKSYGNVKAVNDLSFCVKQGELFAFLGVNGAGKSTTINILCGGLKKDSGKILIAGKDVDDNPLNIKTSLGVVFQESVLDAPLTVYDNLKTRASLYGIVGQAFENRLLELSKMLSFSDLLDRPVGKLSGGQKRRIDIARALLHHPKILILDEPTTGLDPQTRKHLWNVISRLRVVENLTVFLTTHYMEEAVDSDYVVIIDGGKISAQGTPHDLKNTYTGDCVILYGVDESKISTLGLKYRVFKDYVKIFVKDTATATKLILTHPELFNDYEIIKGNMDDVFLNVTGKKIEGGEL